MNTRRHITTMTLFLYACALILPAHAANAPDDMFIIKSTPKTPDAAVAAIKTYATEKKWLYLAESKVKNGEMTVVKLCVPSVAKGIWAAGLHVGAMGPCGNLGIYQENGATRISMLHPKFMYALEPKPTLKQVGDELYPLFITMLDHVSR